MKTNPADVQTLDEGFDLMRDLESEVGEKKKVMRKTGKDLIVLRFKQGRLAEHMMDMPRGDHYGKGLMKELARYAGVNRRTLYKARELARHPQFSGSLAKLKAWMERKEKEKGHMSWRYVRNWTNKHLPEDKEEAENKLEDEIGKLREKAKEEEQSAEDLEGAAQDLEEEVRRRNVEASGAEMAEGAAAEARGVAYKKREVAEDLRLQAERLQVKGAGRIESEAYLDHVRSYPCVACRKPEADAHHIVTGGTGTKAHDLLTIPLCREHHNRWHDKGKHTFCRKHDIRPFQETTYLLMAFVTGADYEALI